MVDRVTYRKWLDKGPWSVVTTPPPETATYLESDDFTHDVRMRVSGDFATVADRELYALALAEALNAAASSNAKVSGAGTASAGLTGCAANGTNNERNEK